VADPAEITRQMFGETLSVAIHEDSGIVGVTHPDGNMVTFWSIQDRQFIKSIKLYRPRGITLSNNNKDFLITAEPNPFFEQSYISGSHIYNWSADMQEISAPGPLI